MNSKIVDTLTQLAIDNPGVRNQFKMAAGIAQRGNLIASGINCHKTHPLMRKFGKNKESICIHAEIDAIKNSLKVIDESELSKCDLYIVRVKRPDTNSTDWVPGLARPCSGCQRAIVAFDFRNVYYTKDIV